MPTWSGILEELKESSTDGKTRDFDGVRRKYLVELYKHTGRNVILYATKWTQGDVTVSPGALSIADEDIQGLMEVMHGLSGTNLDLILHSPGGSLEAAESFVIYIRSRFDNVRVIVPQLAMSAATMIACVADSIVMGKHSFLGPIDPQLILKTKFGARTVPTQAILDQFDRARQEIKDAASIAAWLPMLEQYGPDLLITSENLTRLSEQLVRGWLRAYMFKADPGKMQKARRIAAWLARHKSFKSHGRHIPRSELVRRGLIIEYLENDTILQELVLSIFHATTHSFTGSHAAKIIENHLGKAFVKLSQPVAFPAPGQPQK